jgi:hypothetical protein
MEVPQRVDALRLMNLAHSDSETQRVIYGIGAEVDFGREAVGQGVESAPILLPPIMLGACWCAQHNR